MTSPACREAPASESRSLAKTRARRPAALRARTVASAERSLDRPSEITIALNGVPDTLESVATSVASEIKSAYRE